MLANLLPKDLFHDNNLFVNPNEPIHDENIILLQIAATTNKVKLFFFMI